MLDEVLLVALTVLAATLVMELPVPDVDEAVEDVNVDEEWDGSWGGIMGC